MMNGREKSDSVIVARKPANNAGKPAAEWAEPRTGTKRNTGQPHTCRAQNRVSVSQGLDRVRQAARQRKQERFTALLHHVTIDRLRESFFALKGPHDVDAGRADRGCVAPPTSNPSSVAGPAFRRQTLKVGARGPNWARRDLCGGCPVMGIPTAIGRGSSVMANREAPICLRRGIGRYIAAPRRRHSPTSRSKWCRFFGSAVCSVPSIKERPCATTSM